MRSPIDYDKGDIVRIISGSYKEHLYGTFIRYSGIVKACVKVDNDNQQERNLNRSSIRPVNAADEQVHGYKRVKGKRVNVKEEGGWAPTMEHDDIEKLLFDLLELKIAIEKMEVCVKAFRRN
jgi:hypothetical protein